MNGPQKYRLYRDSGALDRVRDAVESLMQSQNAFAFSDRWWRHYLTFFPTDWLRSESARPELGFLAFVFNSRPGSLRVQLILYAVPRTRIPANQRESPRAAWLDHAWKHVPPFNPSGRELGKTNNTLYSCSLLGPSFPHDISRSDIDRELQGGWKSFVEADCPRLLQVIGSLPKS